MKVEGMLLKSKTITRLALTCALALSLAGCSSDPVPELTINSVSIYTTPDANQNSATAVDVVIIYDQELVKSIGQMSASQYFSSTRQLLLDNPTLINIWHWELVPGQVVQNFTPEEGATKAYAGYVFANYLTPGDHRLKVAPSGNIKILLQKTDLSNLSTENLVVANQGTTMSDAVKTSDCTGQSPQPIFDDTTDECCPSTQPTCCPTGTTGTAGTVTVGTVTPPTTAPSPPKPTCGTPTASSSPCPSPQSGCTGQPVLKQPIPIATRPLNIPPALRKNTPGSKVKYGQSKS
jgi:hypothetical protein